MLIALVGCATQPAAEEAPAAPAAPEAPAAPAEEAPAVEAPVVDAPLPPSAVEIHSTIPKDGATNSGPNQKLTATFKEAIDDKTFTFVLLDDGTELTGEVKVTGKITRLTPDQPLESGKTYTARISGELNHEWSFTTV